MTMERRSLVDGEVAAERVEEKTKPALCRCCPIMVTAMASPKHTDAKVCRIPSKTKRACRSTAAAAHEAHVTITAPVVALAGCPFVVVATGVDEEVA